MQLAYAVLLPDGVHNFVRSVQAALYARYGGSRTTLALEPHVTLKMPFEAADVAPHEAYLDRLAAELEPFELLLRGWGFFPAEGVVYLDVGQEERLFALQRRIRDELALEPAAYESGAPDPYRFHATLAEGLLGVQLEEARRWLPQTPEFRFPLRRLGLFRYQEETWTLYRRVKL